METIRCSSCARRCAVEDAVCLFCGADRNEEGPTAGQRVARFAVRAGGTLAIASAVILAPVLLGACGCGGCGGGRLPDQDTGAADAGPNGRDSGPQR